MNRIKRRTYEEELLVTQGIYKIINTITNDYYIGSTINCLIRRNGHFRELRKNIHKNLYLQNSVNKYGLENFKFEIIEYIKDGKLLTIQEQFWINFLNPKYNIIRKVGEIPTHLRDNSWEEVVKIPVLCYNLKGEFIKRYDSQESAKLDGFPSVGQVLKGKYKFTKKHIFIRESEFSENKLSNLINLTTYKVNIFKENRNGLYKRSLKTFYKENPSYIRDKYSNTIQQYDKQMNLIKEWKNIFIEEVANEIGIKRTALNNCLSGWSNSSGGFIWKYKINN